MPLTFEQPLWLLILLLIAPAALTGLLWFRAMTRIRAWSAIILRSILIALIACILAGASAVHTTERLAVIAVVDISDSVKQFATSTSQAPKSESRRGDPSSPQAPSALSSLRDWITTAAASATARGPDDLLGIVVFDGASIAVMLPRSIAALTDPAAQPSSIADFSLDYTLAEGTNIEQAIRFASALFPPDAARRIVLISDGNETEGDALSAARELAANTSLDTPATGIPIDVLPISYNVRNEVMVQAVDAPPQAAAGSSVTVRIVLTSTDATRGTLDLLYEGEPLDINGAAPGRSRRIELTPGQNIHTVQVKLTDTMTVHRFRPIFSPESPGEDRLTINNSGEAFTVTPGKGAVLVIDGVGAAAASDSPGRNIARVLDRAGISTVVIPAREAPADLLSFQAYDLVILQNIAAEDLPRASHQFLADYVSELGGGLVMVGGPDSFGAGAWKGTALEPILPVKLDLPEQLLVPSAAVVIVLDNSGSMNTNVAGSMRSQQEIANEGAALAVETLDKSDMICVIAFNSDYDIVVPMQRNKEAQKLADTVRAIGSGGGTEIYPAIARAGQELSQGEAARASVRHIIALTDGRSQGDAAAGIATVARLREQGITVSTIAIGDDADTQTLSQIAQTGGGQFYQIVDPNLLPRVFIKEIRVVRKPLIRETPFTPIDLRSGSPLISAVPRPYPALRGLVLTQARKDPTVSNILATPEGEPVLASWFVGRGQVAAFTSDAHRWARDWVETPAYTGLWTQIARTIARPAADRASEIITEIVGDDIVVRLDATDEQGRPQDMLSIPGTLYTPGGKRIDLTLSQIGPGAYETRAPARERGNYFVVLNPRQGERRLTPVIGGASRALGAEFRALRSNTGLLRQIAEVTRGRTFDITSPETADLFTRERIEPVRAASPIWRILLAWAIAIFLLDVATRRVAWDRLISRELAREVRAQAAAAVRARSDQAAATLANLRRAAETSSQAPKPSSPQAPLLTPVQLDAEALEARRARLREQLQQRLARLNTEGEPQQPPPEEDPGADAERTTSGLLAAKRRAAKKYDQPESN